MSFVDEINKYDLDQLKHSIYATDESDVERVLKKNRFSVNDFPVLISSAAKSYIETMAALSKKITLLRFGKTVKLYAPVYISNECVNACKYCGFNIANKIERVTLSRDEVLMEAEVLYNLGFRHILLVSGEAKDKVPVEFIAEIAEELSKKFAAVSIEVYPVDTEEYRLLVKSGVTGIAVYQETYDRELYSQLHKGPKADYNYRLKTPERAGEAGFREIGVGALIGLTDFRVDMTCVAMHAAWLMKKYWKTQLSVSFPRLRNAQGGFQPAVDVSDRDLAQLVFALRMVLPDADLVLSTRENPEFRNGMAGIGITRMSAGSRTNPGGYLKAESSLEQFEVADKRPPVEIAEMLISRDLEPVWKDFDPFFIARSLSENGFVGRLSEHFEGKAKRTKTPEA